MTALLDRVGQVLLFDDMSGVLSLGGRVVLEAQPHAGVRTRGVWFVVLDKPDGPVLLRSVFDRGEPAWRVKLPLPSRVLKASGGRIRLLPDQRGVIVLSSLPPFDVLAYSDSGKLTRRLRLADEPSIQRLISPDGKAPSGNWRLVAGAPVDSLDLLTLSDLNSDRRALVLMDPERGVRSSRELMVPLAVLASNHRWLLAGRRTDHFELVRYQWGWDHSFKEEP